MGPKLYNHKLSYVPDKKDHKLINYISDNARDSFTQIGKSIGVSKDRVRERLLRLEKQLFILSYFPLINYRKLGLDVYHILIRLDNIKLDKIIVARLKNCPNITSITSSVGKYDLYIKFLSTTHTTAKDTIENILQDNLRSMDILTLDVLERYSMKIDSKHISNKFGGSGKIDLLDRKILSSLSVNGRKSLVDMSNELSVPVDTLRYRVKILSKNDIILSYHARTNKHRMGLTTYIVFLKLQNFSKIYCFKEFHNVYYSAQMSGKYNYIIHFHCKSISELYNMIKHLRELLNETLLDFDVLTILSRVYFSPFNANIQLRGDS